MIKDTQEFCSPVHLTAQHDLEDFQSGEESLDSSLRGRAIDNMEMGASRTYVICPSGSRKVIGYYAICMGHIINQEVIGSMRRNMPRHIPYRMKLICSPCAKNLDYCHNNKIRKPP